MIIRNITGDVTAPIKGIIGHGVNCQGAMGNGVAAAIRSKFPKAYTEYMELCAQHEPEELLGGTQLVQITDDLYVANMFTQLNFGGDGKVYASIDAIKSACRELVNQRDEILRNKNQGQVQLLAESLLEVYVTNQMSPRQAYYPDAPFFADVGACGQDRVTGDLRRANIIELMNLVVRRSQDPYPTDDFTECLYELEIFLPRIGAGLGGLQWPDVQQAINTSTQRAPVAIYTL